VLHAQKKGASLLLRERSEQKSKQAPSLWACPTAVERVIG